MKGNRYELFSGIYVATIGIVTNNMLNIYVTAGIFMSNIPSNCVIVYTCIDKPICFVLQTEVHSNFLPMLCLQYRFDLARTSCLFHFFRLSWLLLAPIVVHLIR